MSLRCAFVGIFLLACLGLPARAQEMLVRQIFDDKTGSYVEVQAMFSILPASGYAPVRVTIANRKDAPAGVSLRCSSQTVANQYYRRGGGGKLKTESFFAVKAQGRETKVVDLLVPVSAMCMDSPSSGMYGNEATLEFQVSGVVNQGASQSSGGGKDFPQVLLAESLFTPHSSALDGAMSTMFSGMRGRSDGFAGKFTPEKMPEDWRGYAGYDTVVMQDEDWQKMSPGARSALRKWIKLGGHLRVYAANSAKILEEIRPDAQGASGGKSGVGRVTMMPPPLIPSVLVDAVYEKGAAAFHQSKAISEDYSSSIWGLQGKLVAKSFNYLVFIVVLIVFGVMVGPVNLFVFARAGKRHKLFVTTPLISLAASCLMVGLIFLQDGVGGRGYRVQHMQIEAEGEDYNAYVHQEQFSRTGVLFGKRFEVTEAATMVPVPILETQWARLFHNLRNDQNYNTSLTDKGFSSGGDWMQSRSEQGQVLRAVIPSRARIEGRVEKREGDAGNEGYVMQSYFEYEIDEFGFIDGQGKYWKARGVLPGKNFRLEESTEAEYRAMVTERAKLLSVSASQRAIRMSNRMGSFVAVTTKAPMVETFDNVKWMEDTSIITGMVRISTP